MNSIEKETKARLLPDCNDANSFTFTMQTKHINSPKYNYAVIQSRSRCITLPSVQV